MGLEKMYQGWVDSDVTVPFPFTYKARGGEQIKQTWSDVRSRIQADGQSITLQCTTRHFTPTNVQSEIIKQAISRETRALSPRTEASVSPRSHASSLSPHALSVSPSVAREEIPLPSPPARVMTARHDVAAMGRRAYLNSRRIQPSSNDEIEAGWMASSRSYGRDVTSRKVSHADDFRRKSNGIKEMYRHHGVFPPIN